MKESYTQLAKKSTALKMIRAKTSEQNSTSLSTVATLPLPKKKEYGCNTENKCTRNISARLFGT
jgi:hypothetical protein